MTIELFAACVLPLVVSLLIYMAARRINRDALAAYERAAKAYCDAEDYYVELLGVLADNLAALHEGRELRELPEAPAPSGACPNDGSPLRASRDPRLAGCLECERCGFVQGFGEIRVPGGAG